MPFHLLYFFKQLPQVRHPLLPASLLQIHWRYSLCQRPPILPVSYYVPRLSSTSPLVIERCIHTGWSVCLHFFLSSKIISPLIPIRIFLLSHALIISCSAALLQNRPPEHSLRNILSNKFVMQCPVDHVLILCTFTSIVNVFLSFFIYLLLINIIKTFP